MRRIDFTPPLGEDPFWTLWKDDAQAATAAMLDDHRQGRPVRADDVQLWSRLKGWLSSNVFANKCAYCEGDASPHAPQHAEHWRPKGKVTFLSADGSEAEVKRGDDPHPGYWWLAYDWRNLVPSCFYCNAAGAKGTKFPIDGAYVFSPEEASDFEQLDHRERPWLLHPYGPLRPEEHIGFYADGTAYARDGSRYGYWTITVMDLNRERLVNARRQRQEEGLDALAQATNDFLRHPNFDLAAKMTAFEGHDAEYCTAVRDHLELHRGRLRDYLSQEVGPKDDQTQSKGEPDR